MRLFKDFMVLGDFGIHTSINFILETIILQMYIFIIMFIYYFFFLTTILYARNP